MKGKFRSLAAGAAVAVALASAGVLAGGGAAFAAGGGGPTPPWESSVSPAPNGFITFYNAEGQVVTGGSITASGLGAYAVASTPITGGYTKATLFVYTPVAGSNPGTWSGEGISLSTNYPNASAPAPIGTTANPAETNSGSDSSLSSYIESFPNTQTASGYPGLYDVRMKVSGGGLPTSTTYWDTVISVNTSNNTWSVDYPDYTQNTTTTLSASPPSPQTAPASPVTLQATVAPAAAGTVSFWTGSTQVGATQTVTTSNGVATVTTTPPTGSTPYQAVFTPAVGSSDIGSASSALNYVVQVPLDSTNTTLAETGGGGPAGPVTFTGTVTDTTNTSNVITDGTVSLYDNGSASPFATGSVGAGGAYSITYTYSAAGSHSVVATYSGDAATDGSSSAPVTFTEQAPACTTCNDAQAIEATVPAGAISISTPYTAANPLNLGTLQLTPGGQYFTASVPLDGNSADVPTAGQYPDTTFNGITVVDTQSGSLPWTVTAAATNLTDGTGHPNGVISGENVGLTNLTPVFVSGNAIVSGDVTVTNQPAATPPVAPLDPGMQGLGGGAHIIATDNLQPDGTVGINGTVTLNAPTSTEAGLFTGTITFTITG
jgi:Bacterial Ig-like domain (group 3)